MLDLVPLSRYSGGQNKAVDRLSLSMMMSYPATNSLFLTEILAGREYPKATNQMSSTSIMTIAGKGSDRWGVNCSGDKIFSLFNVPPPFGVL